MALPLVALISLSTISAQHTYLAWEQDLAGVPSNAYIGVIAGTSSDHIHAATVCDIAVGIFTISGSFGCVLHGGITLGETKWCKLDREFRMWSTAYPARYGVFVAQQKDCFDGLLVKGVKLRNPNKEDEWFLDNWIEYPNVGAVIQWSHGTHDIPITAVINAYFTPFSDDIVKDISYAPDLTSIDTLTYVGVEAGSSSDHIYANTACDIAVGYWTKTGGFGCILYGGIGLGEIKWCKPEREFAISGPDSHEFGVFVVQQKDCSDGLLVKSVTMGNQNDYESWDINKWIEYPGVGLVMADRNGYSEVANAYFTSSGSSAAASPSVIIRDSSHNDHNDDNQGRKTKYFYNDWTYFNLILTISLGVSLIVHVGVCKKYVLSKRKVVNYQVVKKDCSPEDSEQESSNFL